MKNFEVKEAFYEPNDAHVYFSVEFTDENIDIIELKRELALFRTYIIGKISRDPKYDASYKISNKPPIWKKLFKKIGL